MNILLDIFTLFLHIKATTIFNDGHLFGENATTLTENTEKFYELVTTLAEI
jgi:hypothetical protein